jgi:hypothetical protein
MPIAAVDYAVCTPGISEICHYSDVPLCTKVQEGTRNRCIGPREAAGQDETKNPKPREAEYVATLLGN